MTPLEVAALTIGIFAFLLGYGLGYQSGRRNADEMMVRSQARSDRLADELDEMAARACVRPVGGVGEVIPLRREWRDRDGSAA